MTSAELDVGCLYYELADDVATNRRRLLAGLAEGLSRTDLVVGPETATVNTGRPTAFVREHAEPVDGPTVAAAQQVVDERGGRALFGLVERADSVVYNACVLLAPDVSPRVYRQPAYEYTHGWTTGHGDHRLFDAGGTTVAPVLCGELELAAKQAFLRERPVDLLSVPANWAETNGYDPILQRVCAVSRDLGCPIAVANVDRPAERSEQDFAIDGPAAIVDGDAVLGWTTDAPGVVVATPSL